MSKKIDRSRMNNDFQLVISELIRVISDESGEYQYKCANKIFIQPNNPKPFSKEKVCRILSGERAIPKDYYEYLSTDEFREAFFRNINCILQHIDDLPLSEFAKFIQDNFYPEEKNEGDNVLFVEKAIREILNEVLTQRNKPIYFRNSKLPERNFFYGRKDELYELEQSLDSNGYAVLSGEPGIGKFEIALQYARSNYKSKYSHVICVPYKGSLADTFKYILKKYSNDTTTAELPNAYNLAVSNMNRSGDKLLVIIKRMNVDFINNTTYLNEFMRYHFHLIITTKSRFEGSISVPNLPYKYSLNIRKSVDEQFRYSDNRSLTITGVNPFLMLLEMQASKSFEFEHINKDYLGSQRLSYKWWLYKLYDIQKLPTKERHILKFLSVFSDTTYSFGFVNYICKDCTQSMVDSLVSLGWLFCISSGMYCNSYGWWIYFQYESFDVSEFSDEISKIMKCYNDDFNQADKILTDIDKYGLLALRINDTTEAWTNFCNHISTQLLKTNPQLAYKIMHKTNTLLSFHITEARKLWNEIKMNETESFLQYRDYVFLDDDYSLSKKRELTNRNFNDRLEYDINIIEWLAEQTVHSMLFDSYIGFGYLPQIQKIVECYSSVTNIFGAFESDPMKFIDFVEKIVCERRGEDNTLYNNIVSFCEQYKIKKPKHELIIKMIDLMPMIRMINNLNNIIGCTIMEKGTDSIDGYINDNYRKLRWYSEQKHHKYSLVFYDIFASCYIIRSAPDKAASCLNDANIIISQCTSDIEKVLHCFESDIIRQKIKIYRFFNSNTKDTLENKTMLFLDECINSVTSDYDDFYNSLAVIQIFGFAEFCAIFKLNGGILDSIGAKIDEQVKTLNDAGIGTISSARGPLFDIHPGLPSDQEQKSDNEASIDKSDTE